MTAMMEREELGQLIMFLLINGAIIITLVIISILYYRWAEQRNRQRDRRR